MPTLLTYASAHGSTAEIANRIGAIIESKGVVIEILPVQEVSDLSKYSSAIVGSAIQNYEWIQPAQTFLHDNSKALSKIPVWAFSVGCPWTVPKRLQKLWDVDSEEQSVKNDIEKEVKLQQHTLFNGKFLKSHFNF